ncbi:ribonuclease E activity regulator RraA [Brevundimonas goettingensis]|uniref:4-hydroxy-4-methyl-2-oxoglutarate aldolase n=1 Tax=Brevundimonas goettingensis TaxID=2774190 RepID=A0A975GW99_9CAUL|nr:ribonuclease E activity regulator RraA [Brevundimonas goettingensis]QTC91539.1 ribonuclease E activity regulator RraA [Brevundimonas goettingensis]
MSEASPPASPATADLIDAHEAVLVSCPLQFRNLGGRARFHGPVRTLKVLEDNALVKSILSSPGQGAVLVIDGGGSLNRALIGDIIAGLAVANGWVGVVVNGAIRDSVAIGALDLGLKALGTNPAKSRKTGAGEADISVTFGGVTFAPGQWLYSDEDGIVVAPHALPF